MEFLINNVEECLDGHLPITRDTGSEKTYNNFLKLDSILASLQENLSLVSRPAFLSETSVN